MTFIEILLSIIVLTLSIIAIKISFKFDINKFLENRRKIKINQLKNICPHGRFIVEDDKLKFESFFSSPYGTTVYICSQCGLVVNSESEVYRMIEPLINNPKLVLKKQKKYYKQAKKLKLC
jgi:hypothetical protein